ncbi:hypothetical protein L083_6595 [Actinoplanes sp. N902-109]|nr:hypothetical protein L083_6595 [Actinoplanes sp. N902-109]
MPCGTRACTVASTSPLPPSPPVGRWWSISNFGGLAVLSADNPGVWTDAETAGVRDVAFSGPSEPTWWGGSFDYL